MRFDAYAVLANLRTERGGRATPATCATQHPESLPHVAQVAHVARRIAPNGEIDRHPVSEDPCRTSRTCRTGEAAHSESVIPFHVYAPEAIRQGVAHAFADHEAKNDPLDPRAWA